jgi:type I restriction enzyme S subunit
MIPHGWQRKRVRDVLEIDNAKRKPISSDDRAKMAGPFPYYGPTQIQDWIDHYAYNGRYALIGEDGDHFLKFSTMSMTQIADGQFNINNHAHAIKGTALCESDWFYYYFQNRDLREYLTRQGAKRYKLTKAALEDIPLLVPPPLEQRRVISILEAWDRAIQIVEALIVNARAQKKALMQALLTGRRRLPGFSRVWREERIGEISTRITRRNDGTPLPVLTISSTFGFVRQDEKYSRFMAGKSVEDYIVLRKGEFAYNKGNSKTYEFGCVFDLDEFGCGLVPHVYVCFKLKDGYSHRFYKALFEADYLAPQLGRLVNTGVRNNGLLNITPVQFLSTSVPVPPTDEQNAIAAVMETASAKVRALQDQLAGLREEKAALMQQLLTGKRRVKVDEREAA